MLTKKQYELLVFINRRLSEGGVSPSFEEMKEALGLKSKSGIHCPIRRPPVNSSDEAVNRNGVASNPMRPSTIDRAPPPPVGTPKRPRMTDEGGPGSTAIRAAPLA